jgi:hypothetical protein
MDEDGTVEEVERLTGCRAGKRRIGDCKQICTIRVPKADNLVTFDAFDPSRPPWLPFSQNANTTTRS